MSRQFFDTRNEEIIKDFKKYIKPIKDGKILVKQVEARLARENGIGRRRIQQILSPIKKKLSLRF